MTEISEINVRKALQAVMMPGAGRDIISLDKVSGLALKPDVGGLTVSFVIEVDPSQGTKLEDMRQQAEKAVRQLSGVSQVNAVLTAHRTTKSGKAVELERKSPTPQMVMPGIGHIVAVASGKGGVGKSTTAVNLAIAFAAAGQRTGLFDADIYGPSAPRMLGIKTKPSLRPDKKLEPVVAHGLKVMSMGFLLAEEDSPLIWRGPMVQGAIQQMLRDVAWGELDIMVIDLPPGTGDAQLAITQLLPLSGAVIVSTPQDIALIDAKRGLHMFKRVNVPVLGIVENMSYYICPHCQGRSEIFSHGGAKDEASKLGCAFLGSVPLELQLRQDMDDGTPPVSTRPQSPTTQIYMRMARSLLQDLSQRRVASAQSSETGTPQ